MINLLIEVSYLTLGVERAKKLKCTYVALHDVDMLPMDVDYSYVNRPTHLATNFVSDVGEKNYLRFVFRRSYFISYNGLLQSKWVFK